MPVQDAMGTIARAVKDLRIRWEEARGQWKDEVGEEFEAKYLQEWERDIRTVASQVDTMSVYLQQVRRDCE
jgi:uncharacterized protein YukE